MKRNQIIEILIAQKPVYQEKYGVEEIGIFGSMARGDDTEISDVDIVVIMPPKLFNMVRLKEDLEELLGLPVDIIRYREQMFAPLKQSIDEEAIYV